MSYFDSPKNQALWKKELSDLKKQKELRKQGLDKPIAKSDEPSVATERSYNKNREKTSYQELLREEAEAVKSARAEKKERMAQRVRTRETEKKAPEMNGRSM